MNLLDMRRQGADMPESLVLKALVVTGDIEPDYIDQKLMRELVAEIEN